MIPAVASASSGPSQDHTADLPDECLVLIFQSLGSGNRKQCTLVCRRWLIVEGQSRHRLSLDARAVLLEAAPSLFSRFDAVSKLALRCDRRSDSIGDEALTLISIRCPNLTHLKLRACRALTECSMAALAKHCPNLRKISCGSCTFGAKGVEVVLRGCPLLEELSIKHLRGLSDASPEPVGPGAASSSLRSICLKELYDGQCFALLIAGFPNLKTLKLFRCSGDWDRLLEAIAEGVPRINEIHLAKLQVSDRSLAALSSCADLKDLHLVKTPECTDAGLATLTNKCRSSTALHHPPAARPPKEPRRLPSLARTSPFPSPLQQIIAAPAVTARNRLHLPEKPWIATPPSPSASPPPPASPSATTRPDPPRCSAPPLREDLSLFWFPSVKKKERQRTNVNAPRTFVKAIAFPVADFFLCTD